MAVTLRIRPGEPGSVLTWSRGGERRDGVVWCSGPRPGQRWVTPTGGRAEYVLLRWRRGVAVEIEPEVDWRAVLHVADQIRGATGLLVQRARRMGDPERWHLPGCPDATDAIPAAEAMPTQRRAMVLRRLIATDIDPRAICPACLGHLTGPTP